MSGEAAKAVEALPAELNDELAALETRGRGLVRRGAVAALGTLGLVAGAGVAHWLSVRWGPDASLAVVQVPQQILDLFPGTAPGGEGAGFQSAVQSAADSIRGIFMVLVKVIAGLGFVAGIFHTFTSMREGRSDALSSMLPVFIMVVGAGVVLPVMMNVLGFEDSGPVARSSQQEAFQRAVAAGNSEQVQQMLKGINASRVVTSYMLAQFAGGQAQSGDVSAADKASLHAMVDEVDAGLAKGMPFTADERVVFALEKTAYGAPRSDIAKSYYAGRLQPQANAALLSQVLGGLAALAALASTGVLGLGAMIRARVSRIRALVNRPTEGVVVDAGSAVTMEPSQA